MKFASNDDVQRIDDELLQLQQELVQTKNNVQSWTDANASLSRSTSP